MPMHDFCCDDCKIICDDVDLPIGRWEDPPQIVDCPECGKPMRKLIQGVRFKVKGFSLRSHRMKLESRMRRREQRDDWKKLSEDQKWRMRRIADKYGSGSVWTGDSKKTKGRADEGAEERAKKKERKKMKKLPGVKDVEFN